MLEIGIRVLCTHKELLRSRRDIKHTRRISKRCQLQPRSGGKRDRKYLVRRRSKPGKEAAALEFRKSLCELVKGTPFVIFYFLV